MSTTTINLGLIKPDLKENADIGIINANMDTIDTAFANSIANTKFLNSTIETVTELEMQSDIAKMVTSTNLNKFYTDFTHTMSYSDGTIDSTIWQITNPINAGASSVTLISVVGLAVGMEVSIQNANNYEDKIILSIIGNTVTFNSPFVNTYTSGSIYRSSNNGINFGNIHSLVNINKTTPTTFSILANSMFSNAGIQFLSNGWFVFAGQTSVSTAVTVTFYVSKDNFTSVQTLCTYSYTASINCPFSLASSGTIIYFVNAVNGGAVTFVSFDATTVGSTITPTNANVETGGYGIYSTLVSIAVDINGNLTIAWIAIISSYYQIRSVKSTNKGLTWTKQNGTAGVDTITSVTATANDVIGVFAMYDNSNNALIISNTATNTYCNKYNSSSGWSALNTGLGNAVCGVASVLNGVVQKYGIKTNRLWVATGTAVYYSDDAITWTAASGISAGSFLTTDNTGSVYALYVASTTVKWQSCPDNTTTFGGAASMGTNSALYGQVVGVANLYMFTAPVAVFFPTPSAAVYGNWTNNSLNVSVSKNIIRMNINPYVNVTQLAAFITTNKLAGFTVTGYLSIVASGGAESYTALTNTVTDISTAYEDTLLGQVTTPNRKVTLKLVLQRAAPKDQAQITKIIGGVA